MFGPRSDKLSIKPGVTLKWTGSNTLYADPWFLGLVRRKHDHRGRASRQMSGLKRLIGIGAMTVHE